MPKQALGETSQPRLLDPMKTSSQGPWVTVGLPSKDGEAAVTQSWVRERASARKGAALSEPMALWGRLVGGESS